MKPSSSIPITRPTLPRFALIESRVKEILSTGQLTNGKYVREFEKKYAAKFGIKHTVALSSCTDGLTWVMRFLAPGEIVLPSFTFCATGNAAHLAGHKLVFADCRRDTFNLDPTDVESKITDRTRAIVATYIYGNPPDIDSLKMIAKKYKVKLILDAAHATGAKSSGRYAGTISWAEVFSLTPTKALCCAEGGMVATADSDLAEFVRLAREYGNPGDYNTRFVGTNARMTEFNAILGIEGLKRIEKFLAARNVIAARYRKGLGSLPGVSFPEVGKSDYCGYKDFTILIDPNEARFSRNQLRQYLEANGISVRCYFDPPLHRQRAFVDLGYAVGVSLPNTEYVSQNCLSLPMFSHMDSKSQTTIVDCIKSFASGERKLRGSIKSKPKARRKKS